MLHLYFSNSLNSSVQMHLDRKKGWLFSKLALVRSSVMTLLTFISGPIVLGPFWDLFFVYVDHHFFEATLGLQRVSFLLVDWRSFELRILEKI